MGSYKIKISYMHSYSKWEQPRPSHSHIKVKLKSAHVQASVRVMGVSILHVPSLVQLYHPQYM